MRYNLQLAVPLFVGITIADWVTKIAAEQNLARRAVPVIEDFFYLRLAYNRGVAFSAFESLPHWVLGTGAILLLGFVLYAMRALAEAKLGAVALSMVAAGGLNNAVDRLLDGKVTDMIAVWKWPVFNIADIGITVGVGLMLIASRKVSSKAKAAVPVPAAESPSTPPPAAGSTEAGRQTP